MSATTNIKSAYSSYGYADVNGSPHYGQFIYNSNTKSLDFISYGRYIGISKVSCSMDSEETFLTIEFDPVSGLRKEIDVSRGLLAKPHELQALLLSLGADAHSGSTTVLMKCLRESERTVKKIRSIHQSTGWIVKQRGATTDLSFKSKVLIDKHKLPEPSKYTGLYDLSMKGSFDGWKNMALSEIIGNIPLEISILIGLSPIVSSLFGTRNLIYHFMGDSSKGKTTAASACISVAGCPNPLETASRKNAMNEPLRPLMSSWSGTSNAHIKKLQALNGTIMVLDELSKLTDVASVSNIIYSISDGGDKDRMNSLSTLQAVSTFKTNILSVGEESLLDKAMNENTGLSMRVCEIQADFTKDAAHAEAIMAGCYENYGFAAPKFAAYIIRKLGYDKAKQLYDAHLDAYEQALIAAGIQSTSPRRLAEFGAVLLTTAEIAEKALSIKFSMSDIEAFMVAQQVASNQNQDIGHRAHTALWNYVNQNIAHFATGKGISDWTKSIACYGRIETSKSGVGKEVSFDKASFRMILKTLGFNNSTLILQKFKALGLLDHEAKKLDRKRTITAQGGQIRVFTVLFP